MWESSLVFEQFLNLVLHCLAYQQLPPLNLKLPACQNYSISPSTSLAHSKEVLHVRHGTAQRKFETKAASLAQLTRDVSSRHLSRTKGGFWEKKKALIWENAKEMEGALLQRFHTARSISIENDGQIESIFVQG